MPSFYDLSLLAQAVYADVPTPTGWACKELKSGSAGFQAGAYTRGGETVVAFRGTTASAGDVAADLKLGVGMNTSHFSQGEAFMDGFRKATDLTVCGHSLGGAIAQIVGNRRQIKFATFNAPGVAVFASRNIMSADPAMLVIRAAGAAVGALFSPMQAARDVAAAFNVAVGVNICLNADVVSQIGVHYGKVVRIPGTDFTPWSQHGIATVVQALDANRLGRLGIGDYFSA